MRRHGDKIKSKPCWIQDQNRRTWCTTENFTNMYNSVYEAIVEFGAAINLDEEVMLDYNGNVTTDPGKMHGRKTS
jgi:hypothetical protein